MMKHPHPEKDYEVPGSVTPVRESFEPVDPEVRAKVHQYMEERHYKVGRPILIQGPRLSGKTTLGLYIVRAIFDVEPLFTGYWKEHDFLEDTRETWHKQKLMESYGQDMGLWVECSDFNNRYREYCFYPRLFLDDVGIGYSDWNLSAVETLLHDRNDQQLLTVISTESDLWDALPKRVRIPFEDGMVLYL